MSLERLKKGVEGARDKVHTWFAKREKTGGLSKVHDWSHVYAVARHAKIVAEELALKEGQEAEVAKQAGLLAEAAGYLHDVMRKATEREPHGILGKKFIERAYAAPPFPTSIKKRFFTEFTLNEIKIIADAVELHESSWKEFGEKSSDIPTLMHIVTQAVRVGDKVFEASGYRVLERRSFFVGKERMQKDLKPLEGVYGEKAPLYAVAMESAIRLRAINAIKDMPLWVQPIAKPLHAVQEEFYYSLLKHLGLNEEELFEEMKRVKFPKFDKYEKQIRENAAEADSNESIRGISADAADSAAELVYHFVNSKNPDEAILSFKPKGEKAAKWLEQIKAYREGSDEYLELLRNDIRTRLH